MEKFLRSWEDLGSLKKLSIIAMQCFEQDNENLFCEIIKRCQKLTKFRVDDPFSSCNQKASTRASHFIRSLQESKSLVQSLSMNVGMLGISNAEELLSYNLKFQKLKVYGYLKLDQVKTLSQMVSKEAGSDFFIKTLKF